MTDKCEKRIDQELADTMDNLAFMVRLIEADDWDSLDKKTIDFVENFMGHYAEGDIQEHTWAIVDEYGIWFGLDQNYHGTPYEFADELEVWTDEYGYGLAEACDAMGHAPLHWQFSYGGPSDGMIITLMKVPYGWDVVKAYYYFQDWFDGAWRELSPSQLGILRRVIEYFSVDSLFI